MMVKILNKKIGKGCPTFIIAEIGSNHDGSLRKAKKLINAAAKCGADAVKFQTFDSKKLFNEKIVPEVVKKLKKYEFTKDQYNKLNEYAKSKNIILLSSAFDEKSADMLSDLGIPAFKIASYELTHLPLIRHIALKGKPVIISTGMATLSEIQDAVKAIKSQKNNDIILTHCISNYPTKSEDVNLGKIITLKNKFRLPVGFSDHTIGILSSVAAVALGANVVEKHFTLDRKAKGPDHFFSLEPKNLKKLVDSIREVERMFGSEKIKPSKKEIDERRWRRSIYAKNDIKKGDKIKNENLVILRPAHGMLPKHISKIIGKTAKKKH